jgi:diguanylate cyclase (GGDEF)-like protein
MKGSVQKGIVTGFGLVLLLIASLGWLSNRSTRQFINNSRWVSHSHEVLEKLEGILSLVKDVETGQHSFVVTGNERYLESYEATKREIGLVLQHLQALTSDDPDQHEKLELVRRLATQRIQLSKQTIDLRRGKGFEAAASLVNTDRGKKIMDNLRKTVADLETEERALLRQRTSRTEASAQHTMLLFSILSFLVLALMGLVFFTLHHYFTRRKQAEQLLKQANRELTVWVNELEHSNHEIILLNEMSDLLQSCLTLQEARSIISRHAQQLFPSNSGALFLIGDSQRMLEAVAVWGDKPNSQQLFQPTDCWALRQGQVYQAGDRPSDVRCLHLDDRFSGQYLCIPIIGQGEILGLMHLQSGNLLAGSSGKATDLPDGLAENSQKSRYRLAITVARHVGLALANLKLLETLRNQAVRDPLTGLFNRRHMEESLEREILRAVRRKSPLGIVMIDIDHFKRFNDRFGHAAGDMVLRELSSLLQKQIRGEDLACRYGGEEVTLVLSEASLEDALQRAEQLRREAKHLNLRQGQQALGAITLSLGVAVFPEHGATVEALLGAADGALYRAKAEGRDRVVVAKAAKQSVEPRSPAREPAKTQRARALI